MLPAQFTNQFKEGFFLIFYCKYLQLFFIFWNFSLKMNESFFYKSIILAGSVF